jgi:quinol monooxygenase YgiN
MDPKPIIMTVTFQARPGKEAELREALTQVLAPTRQEPGCLFYNLHVAADDPTKFLFHESWATQAHHAAHDTTPHINTSGPSSKNSPSRHSKPGGT